jgi:hypothetical protein
MPDRARMVAGGHRTACGQQVFPGLQPERPLRARSQDIRFGLREQRLGFLEREGASFAGAAAGACATAATAPDLRCRDRATAQDEYQDGEPDA